MKTLVTTIVLGTLATLSMSCGSMSRDTSTLTSAKSNSNYVEGDAVVRVIGQHNYVSIQLAGDQLAPALYQHLSGLEAVTTGDDGDYNTSKESSDMSCGGSTTSPGDMESFEDLSCVINFSRDGKAGVVDNDPFSWANATLKTEKIRVAVNFKKDKAIVSILASADTHVLFDELTGIPEKHDADEDIIHKVGPSIQVDDNFSDGDDYEATMVINTKGLISTL